MYFQVGFITKKNVGSIAFLGISFPSKEMMKEWKHIQEEASKRDHRRIGAVCSLCF